MADLNLYRDRDLGAKAQALRDDPIFNEVIKRFREDLMAQWERTNSDQVEDREELFRLVRLLDGIGARIQSVINDGDIAARRIEDDEKVEAHG